MLGASVSNLWRLLSKDFVLLVIFSCLIAIPIANYFLHEWLQQYQYRTTISWWTFAVTGLSALAVTLLTVSFQAIKAAIANPVKSLRTESYEWASPTVVSPVSGERSRTMSEVSGERSRW